MTLRGSLAASDRGLPPAFQTIYCVRALTSSGGGEWIFMHPT